MSGSNTIFRQELLEYIYIYIYIYSRSLQGIPKIYANKKYYSNYKTNVWKLIKFWSNVNLSRSWNISKSEATVWNRIDLCLNILDNLFRALHFLYNPLKKSMVVVATKVNAIVFIPRQMLILAFKSILSIENLVETDCQQSEITEDMVLTFIM